METLQMPKEICPYNIGIDGVLRLRNAKEDLPYEWMQSFTNKFSGLKFVEGLKSALGNQFQITCLETKRGFFTDIKNGDQIEHTPPQDHIYCQVEIAKSSPPFNSPSYSTT